MIPGALQVQFNFRYSTESTPQSLRERFAAILDRHRLDHDIAWTGTGKPFLTPAGPLVAAVKASIEDVAGITPELSCTGGTSNGRFIADICGEIVELGPVNATIHMIDERVRIADLEPLAAIYRGVLERLLLPGTTR